MTEILTLPKNKFESFEDETYMRRKHPDLCFTDENGQVTAIIMHNQDELKEITIDSHNYGQLKYLNLADNKSLKKVTFLGEFPLLRHLDLSNCNLQELKLPKAGLPALEQFYAPKNKLSDIDFGGNFGKLVLVDLSENEWEGIFNIGKSLASVQYFYLQENKKLENIEIIPEKVNLNTLHLESNAVQNFDPFLLDKLPEIENIYLGKNPLEMSLEGFAEGSKNYLSAIMRKKQDMKQFGYDLNYEYKVLLVGNGNVGKSCLVHRLTTGDFLEDWDTTHGISLTQYPKLEKDVNGFNYTLNLWDFGGQEIYHATHRMFMKSNAVYLLLWDMNTEQEPNCERKEGNGVRIYKNHPLNYWMNYIKSFGKNSPVILIRTKIDKNDTDQGAYPHEAEFRRNFGKDLEFLEVNLKSDKDWKKPNGVHFKIRGAFEGAINSISRAENLPKNWIELREHIREKQTLLSKEKASTTTDFLQQLSKTMPFDEYLKLAKDFEVDNPEDFLENWLVKTGVVYFRKGYFKDKIILDQEWAIRAVYALFDPNNKRFYKSIQDDRGKFNGEDLAEVWTPDYSDEEQELFIDFMLTAELCFEITEKKEKWHSVPLRERIFIAPEFLKSQKPRNVEKFEKRTEDKLIVLYKHSALHYGIMQSFIVRTFSESKQIDDIWKYGIFLTDDDDNTDGVVEMLQEEDTIKVQVSQKGKVLLDKIRNMLDELQIGEFEESFSVNGIDFVKKEVLQLAINKNQPHVVSNDSKVVEVEPLKIFLERDKDSTFKNENMDSIRKLVASGRTKEALKKLIDIAPDNFKSEVDSLNSRFNVLQQKINQGTISSSDENLERNKIVSSLLALITSIKENEASPGEDMRSVPSGTIWDMNQSLRVLFMASNPGETAKLALREESSIINEMVQDNDVIKIQSKFAVNIQEMIDGINDYEPVIVHFSGHGTKGDERRNKLRQELGIEVDVNDAGLIFHDSDKFKSEVLSNKKAVSIFSTAKNFSIPISIVVLNNCYSESQAIALSKIGLFVIGVNETIEDPAAISFSRGVYRAIAKCSSLDEQSLKKAVRDGMMQASASGGNVLEKIFLFHNGEKISLM